MVGSEKCSFKEKKKYIKERDFLILGLLDQILKCIFFFCEGSLFDLVVSISSAANILMSFA